MDIIFETIPTDSRRTARPVGRPKLYDHYTKQSTMFWTESAIPKIADDIPIFCKLKPSEQNMIKGILIFFEHADVMASEIFGGEIYLGPLGDIYEVRQIMNYQTAIEDIHAIQYSRFIDEYIPDQAEKNKYRTDIGSHPHIAAIIEWMRKNISADNIATNLICMSMFEGVLFTGAFAIIFAFRQLISLRTANDYISKDEGCHHETSALLYDLLLSHARLSPALVTRMTREFGELVCNFMVDIVPDDSTCGINKRNIVEFIRYTFDNNLKMLGYSAIFNDKNPYDWYDRYNTMTVGAIHERHTASYSNVDVQKLQSNWGSRKTGSGPRPFKMAKMDLS